MCTATSAMDIVNHLIKYPCDIDYVVGKVRSLPQAQQTFAIDKILEQDASLTPFFKKKEGFVEKHIFLTACIYNRYDTRESSTND